MKTHIALLRGINVSGHKIIKMELLRKVLSELDLDNIRTYIQSGNIIFESNSSDISKLEMQIAAKIEEHFGFVVPVTVVTPGELFAIINKNPYAKATLSDAAQPYVSFLSEIPKNDYLEVLKTIDFKGDAFISIDKTLYIWYSNFAGNSKLSNAIIESKLKLRSTARNWKTVLKLYELATAK
ncbi:hypothetical protein FNO01nite_24300 [Flavobacterium noncentrifugens]|uniref:Uncharacterized conserved protein, DUF1697 family n=1 Tax=Flavobacterium noncentrifugens TaxID=1128970 RepID=A0A1G9A0G0_9FLAO|nr:DUF1697 domain-containing protein [Flavobacterium noncentrifugens]GEP51758.1 hypothetical protein FNO01nite_24300 [Flavobacterium noncentrifugens]SDK20848.1 Uncharacterized conserved protein, DUF1697 family [Flavobacterium noncentrifugens]